MKTVRLALVSILAGCQSYTVLHRGSDYVGECNDPSVDCCTNVHSAWATSPAELDEAVADDAGFGNMADLQDIQVAPDLFDDQAALVLWTDSCPGSDARLQVQSFDPGSDVVTVDLRVALPGIDQEIEDIRPLLVLAPDIEHAGKPVQATAQRQ
jgi:hypothetical protein